MKNKIGGISPLVILLYITSKQPLKFPFGISSTYQLTRWSLLIKFEASFILSIKLSNFQCEHHRKVTYIPPSYHETFLCKKLWQKFVEKNVRRALKWQLLLNYRGWQWQRLMQISWYNVFTVTLCLSPKFTICLMILVRSFSIHSLLWIHVSFMTQNSFLTILCAITSNIGVSKFNAY